MPESTNNLQQTPNPGIVNANVQSYLDVVNVAEVLVGQSNASFVGTKYISSVDVPFKDPRNSLPPKVVVFRTTLGPQNDVNLSEQLPTYEETFDPFVFPLGAFIITRYATYTIYTDKVTIRAGSINDFDETYLIFVLKDKTDDNRLTS